MRKHLIAAVLAVVVSMPLVGMAWPQPEPTVLVQYKGGNPDTRVWVNLPTHVYHCPGDRWYGKTKHGEYMTQAEAQKKGNRPAYGRVCE